MNVLIFKRLVVCNKSFTEIIKYIKEIKNLANEDSEFNALLTGDVFEVKNGQDLINLNKGMLLLNMDPEEELEKMISDE